MENNRYQPVEDVTSSGQSCGDGTSINKTPTTNTPIDDISKTNHCPSPKSAASQNKSKKGQDKSSNGSKKRFGRFHKIRHHGPARFAAIDLGTNNCRLLIATPHRQQFRVVDAYSRIVRLGEGVSASGNLSQEAMDRTVEALKVCAQKIENRNVKSIRAIATQACRLAENGESFLERIKLETGIDMELISTEEEAGLAACGCLDLVDPLSRAVLVFDIGGGSTELSWLKPIQKKNKNRRHAKRRPHKDNKFAGLRRAGLEMKAWTSLPFGVVTLSEKFGGRSLTRDQYEEMVDYVAQTVTAFIDANDLKPIFEAGQAHLLGTSGTVTSIAGLHLNLQRYNRQQVDGLWLDSGRALDISENLRAMSYETRQKQPCIGSDRADLVVPGCAILEGILKTWPSDRIRVADRGLREGILYGLIAEERRRKARRKKPQNLPVHQ